MSKDDPLTDTVCDQCGRRMPEDDQANDWIVRHVIGRLQLFCPDCAAKLRLRD